MKNTHHYKDIYHYWAHMLDDAMIDKTLDETADLTRTDGHKKSKSSFMHGMPYMSAKWFFDVFCSLVSQNVLSARNIKFLVDADKADGQHISEFASKNALDDNASSMLGKPYMTMQASKKHLCDACDYMWKSGYLDYDEHDEHGFGIATASQLQKIFIEEALLHAMPEVEDVCKDIEWMLMHEDKNANSSGFEDFLPEMAENACFALPKTTMQSCTMTSESCNEFKKVHVQPVVDFAFGQSKVSNNMEEIVMFALNNLDKWSSDDTYCIAQELYYHYGMSMKQFVDINQSKDTGQSSQLAYAVDSNGSQTENIMCVLYDEHNDIYDIDPSFENFVKKAGEAYNLDVSIDISQYDINGSDEWNSICQKCWKSMKMKDLYGLKQLFKQIRLSLHDAPQKLRQDMTNEQQKQFLSRMHDAMLGRIVKYQGPDLWPQQKTMNQNFIDMMSQDVDNQFHKGKCLISRTLVTNAGSCLHGNAAQFINRFFSRIEAFFRRSKGWGEHWGNRKFAAAEAADTTTITINGNVYLRHVDLAKAYTMQSAFADEYEIPLKAGRPIFDPFVTLRILGLSFDIAPKDQHNVCWYS